MKNSSLLLKALESIGGEDEFHRKHEQFARSLDFVESNKASLLEQYDESWIAVYDAKIVAHGKDIERVINAVNKTGLSVDEVLIEFLSSKKAITLF